MAIGLTRMSRDEMYVIYLYFIVKDRRANWLTYIRRTKNKDIGIDMIHYLNGTLMSPLVRILSSGQNGHVLLF